MKYYIYCLEKNEEDAFEKCKLLSFQQIYVEAKEQLIIKQEEIRQKELQRIEREKEEELRRIEEE